MKELGIPDGRFPSYSHTTSKLGIAIVISHSFVVSHNFDLESYKANIPHTVFNLISGHLQLGEEINARNLENYEKSKHLKYLPFLIRKKSVMWNIHYPTVESVRKDAETFKEVLEMLLPAIPSVADSLRDIVDYCDLRELAIELPSKEALEEELLERARTRLAPLRKKFGFVYRNLPGPKDAVPFTEEFLSKHLFTLESK